MNTQNNPQNLSGIRIPRPLRLIAGLSGRERALLAKVWSAGMGASTAMPSAGKVSAATGCFSEDAGKALLTFGRFAAETRPN